ncbi:uncharacterized protein LOC122884273 isoform X2 [Siniperca chuatsi]|uniref:uncharacterized protein LOC122884273 isoform X2 n=1 Tax=Siniperca chuatsi TaxID=119488 RepID=UPI001CE1CAE9|nr:uncharacterized protein LOC122884273 isoform X2 [Siniperca chuatsi]
MQTISVVTKRCGCYWACSVSQTAPTSLGCLAKGREGHVAWVCSSERSLSTLWVAWILHAIFTGGRGGSERRAPQPVGSAHFLRCLFENTAAQFCCILAAAQADGLKTGHGGFKAIRRCRNTPTRCSGDLFSKQFHLFDKFYKLDPTYTFVRKLHSCTEFKPHVSEEMQIK